jgi:hypothetical protein
MRNAAESGDQAVLLRLHSGLEGLVRGIAQHDPSVDIFPATTALMEFPPTITLA